MTAELHPEQSEMVEESELGLVLQPGAVMKPGQTLLARTMALIAEGASLGGILETIVRGVEIEHPGMLCSILLLDDSGQRLVHGAAPSLPDFYRQAIDGIVIGPAVGSCGTAAYTGRRTIVRDIQTDPLWADFKDLAREAGLASCWSEPIRGEGGAVLGAFAIYHREARGPTDEDIRTIMAVAHLAAIALERKQALDALTASEIRAEHANARALEHRRLAQMAEEIAGVGHWRRDMKTGAGTWSDELFRIYGLDPADGVPDLDTSIGMLHPDDQAPVAADLEATQRHGAPYARDLRIIRPDGEIRHIMSRAAAERGPDGEVSSVFGVYMDVTEAKRAEQVLRESEERFRLLTEASSDIIMQMKIAPDWSARITYVSPAVQTILGYAPSDFDDLNDAHLMIHPDDLGPVTQVNKLQVLEGPNAVVRDNTYRCRHKDGRWIWLQSRPTFIFDPKTGKACGVIAVMRDVTSEKEADQAIRSSEARYRLLAENVTDIIAQLDLGGVITFITPACERVMGFTPDEMIGVRMLDRIHPDDAPGVLAAVTAHIAAGPGAAPITIEYRARRKDGQWVWIEGRPRVLFDVEGKPVSLQDAVRDISERKAADERQSLMVHELNHRVKNTLATVQSMALHAQKSAETPAAFAQAFNTRLMALSHSHDLLTQNSWSGAWLRELVAEHLGPHQNDNGARFRLAGPDVRVTPKTAVALGMALCELATNAAKYGALSVDRGAVSVGWERRSVAGAPWLNLVWRERGGPPVRQPTRRGFGTRLIEHGLTRELGGSARLTFGSLGASCEIEFPMTGNAA